MAYGKKGGGKKGGKGMGKLKTSHGNNANVKKPSVKKFT